MSVSRAGPLQPITGRFAGLVSRAGPSQPITGRLVGLAQRRGIAYSSSALSSLAAACYTLGAAGTATTADIALGKTAGAADTALGTAGVKLGGGGAVDLVAQGCSLRGRWSGKIPASGVLRQRIPHIKYKVRLAAIA